MANEVEIKFLIEDLDALTAKLRDAGVREVTPSTHEMNTLYDFPDLRLRNAGQLLRLRNYGGQWTITHKDKGAVGRHKSRVETETIVGDGKSMEAVLSALGLKPQFRYEKFRAEWSDGSGHVVVDRTPVGNVAEIEGEPEWIDYMAKRLGVSEDRYMTCTYADLFLQWKERTGSPARHLTFEECGTPAPKAE